MDNRANSPILRGLIALLALADGTLHLSLDWILFRGNLFGSGRPPGPPAGGTPPRTTPPPGGPRFSLPLPTNELFVLNFVGEVVLVLLFLFGDRLLGARRWLIDVAMIVYAGMTFVFWWLYGQPNPMGLGYLSKGIEVVLIVALLVHLFGVLGSPGRMRVGAAGE